jgi:predicted amidohydrolase
VAAGREFCTFDIPQVGRIGLCICYDGWFPEVMRSLVWLGAEVILHPTFTSTPDRPLELIVEQSHAILNQCFMVNTNAAPIAARGRSLIVGPTGQILAEAGTDDVILTAILDLDQVRQAREYGTLGLSQTLKQWRDTAVTFPPYGQGVRQGPLFESLGPLRRPGRADFGF